MKDFKWALVIGGAIFISYAIYSNPEKKSENTLFESDSTYEQNDTNITTINKNDRVFVLDEDTIDVTKDKFIVITADKYRDKNISLGISMWYSKNMNICALSSGVLKISIYDNKMKLLKNITENIEYSGTNCQQNDDINIYMGDLIQKATFINAQFTDYEGENFIQKRKNIEYYIDEEINFNKEDDLAITSLKRKTKILFNELLIFKDKKDFHLYGFMIDYKYNSWLNKVNSLKEDPANKLLLLNDGFVVGELSNLGMEYMRSKGKETEYSKYAREKIQLGLKK